MKLNTNVTDKIFRKSLVDLPTFDLDKNKVDTIFPFDVKTGFVNATEEGIVFSSEVRNYSRFERIFTGFEAVSVQWQDSTSIIVSGNTGAKKGVKNFQPGRALLAQYDNETNTDDFSDLAEDTNFMKERVVTTVKYYMKNPITADDIVKLWIIPGRFKKTIFFIDSVTEYIDPSNNEFKYAEVTFHSLDDKLSNTGLAIDQYVQFSAPGEGFAFPELTDQVTERKLLNIQKDNRSFKQKGDIPSTLIKSGAEFYIEEFVDKNNVNQGKCVVQYNGTDYDIISTINGYIVESASLQNRPIVSAQLEVYSPSILSSVYAMGRPIKSGISQGEQITMPGYLFPSSVNIPDLSQRDITKPLSQNTAWYWIPQSRMEIESFYKNWTEKTLASANPATVKKWLGYLRVKQADLVRPSAPLGARIFTDIFTLGLAEIAWKDAGKVVPDSGYWTLKGMQTLPGLLARGSQIHKNTPRLPLDYRESLPWTLKDVPILGGLLSKLTLGLPTGWKQQKETGGKNYNVSGLMSQSLLDFYRSTWIGVKEEGGQQYTAIPFDALSDAAQQTAISPGDFATILNFDFTNKFAVSSITSDNSIPFPQGAVFTTDENGFNEAARFTETFLPVDKDKSVEGFAIDTFGFHLLGQGTYKLTFFAEENGARVPVYTGTYKTLSKLTGSLRDWNNNVKLSNWESSESFDNRKEVIETGLSLPKQISTSENTIKNGVLVPVYKKDANGDIEIDPRTGEPIPVYNPTTGDQQFDLDQVTLEEYQQPGTNSDIFDYSTDQHRDRWYELNDAPAYEPSNSFDISEWVPDNVVTSLYNAGYRKIQMTVNGRWTDAFLRLSTNKVLGDINSKDTRNMSMLVNGDIDASGKVTISEDASKNFGTMFTLKNNRSSYIPIQLTMNANKGESELKITSKWLSNYGDGKTFNFGTYSFDGITISDATFSK